MRALAVASAGEAGRATFRYPASSLSSASATCHVLKYLNGQCATPDDLGDLKALEYDKGFKGQELKAKDLARLCPNALSLPAGLRCGVMRRPAGHLPDVEADQQRQLPLADVAQRCQSLLPAH